MKTTLFIDGRNFIDKISSILNPNREKDIDFSVYNFKGLIDKALAGININRKIFYFGRLIKHLETVKKSEELIEKQRKLKTHLEEQGFEVILAGRVRGHIEKCAKGHETLTFKEKGVDVKIAVDMVTLACDKELKIAIIGSSDSDLQPAIGELRKRRIERIYLGFENNPNKGLTFTTNRTILVRNSEVVEFLGKTLI
ncbi:NYN domain-containing protein [Patescibacteria group bacterium]|nr:NYN domain-containing protein [Patescibacteria group bacterium]